MVGLDGADALFDALEETGGSKDATLVSHSHTVTDPGHFHSGGVNTSGSQGGFSAPTLGTANTGTATTGITVNTAGSSATDANLQPYITVAMWKRTA